MKIVLMLSIETDTPVEDWVFEQPLVIDEPYEVILASTVVESE
jgi:hypothetical protein